MVYIWEFIAVGGEAMRKQAMKKLIDYKDHTIFHLNK